MQKCFLENPDYIMTNLKYDINRLRWFPKSLVEEKRVKIAELIERMKNDDPKYLSDYIEYRNSRIKVAGTEEFDIFDEGQFKQEVCGKCPYILNAQSNLERMRLNTMKLEFYYNNGSIMSDSTMRVSMM